MFVDNYVRKDIFRCATCDVETEPTDDVDPDEEGLPYPPAGWLRLVGDIVTPSEDYAVAMATRDQQITATIAQAAAGKEASEADLATARDFVEAQLPLPEMAEFVVERMILCLCPAHAAELQKIGAELVVQP